MCTVKSLGGATKLFTSECKVASELYCSFIVQKQTGALTTGYEYHDLLVNNKLTELTYDKRCHFLVIDYLNYLFLETEDCLVQLYGLVMLSIKMPLND